MPALPAPQPPPAQLFQAVTCVLGAKYWSTGQLYEGEGTPVVWQIIATSSLETEELHYITMRFTIQHNQHMAIAPAAPKEKPAVSSDGLVAETQPIQADVHLLR